MKVVAFDIRSDIGHFRRPDTTATQLTYPFIPPTAVKGLVGAILGIEDFTTSDQVGIQLLSEVKIVSQQLSMLGKSSGNTFNRPTTVQLLINPSYRIYYGGEQYVDELETLLQNKQSVYTTYLGSAFAITTPLYVGSWDLPKVYPNSQIITKTIVPSSIINELVMEDGYLYQRANGFLKEYHGNRMFEKSMDFIFEQAGKRLVFKPKKNQSDYTLVDMDGEIVCLV